MSRSFTAIQATRLHTLSNDWTWPILAVQCTAGIDPKRPVNLRKIGHSTLELNGTNRIEEPQTRTLCTSMSNELLSRFIVTGPLLVRPLTRFDDRVDCSRIVRKVDKHLQYRRAAGRTILAVPRSQRADYNARCKG